MPFRCRQAGACKLLCLSTTKADDSPGLSFGYAVLEAHSAKEAIERLEREVRINLVINGSTMPRMRESQLANVVAIRWPNLRVVLVTGYAEMREGANKDLLRLPTQPQLGEIVVKAVTPTSVASWRPAI